jgi:hypothetical protein
MLIGTCRTRVSAGFEFEVVKRGDASDGVVDSVASASALAQDLVVFEAGDGAFGAGAAFSEPPVGAVFGNSPAGPSPGRGDVRVSTVAAVADQPRVLGQSLTESFFEDDGVVAVAGPGVAGGDDAPVAGPADDLGVDAAAVVLGLGGAGLVVDGVQGAAGDPRFPPVGWWRAEEFGEVGCRPAGDAVHGGVGDAEECCELLHRRVRPVGRDEQQDPVGETQSPGTSAAGVRAG